VRCSPQTFFILEAVARIICYAPSPRDAAFDLFVWLDALTVVPRLLSLPTYVIKGELEASYQWQRVLEACAHLRLLKLCRYYESAVR
jgi:hypothetical protein